MLAFAQPTVGQRERKNVLFCVFFSTFQILLRSPADDEPK
jgi:hypothetical protein